MEGVVENERCERAIGERAECRSKDLSYSKEQQLNLALHGTIAFLQIRTGQQLHERCLCLLHVQYSTLLLVDMRSIYHNPFQMYRR